MTEVAARLLFIALVGAVTVAAILWPELRRLRKLWRENDDLQRKHDRLVGENRERARGILERWIPRGESSG